MAHWPDSENAGVLSNDQLNALIQAGTTGLSFPQRQALLAALCSLPNASWCEGLIGQTNTALLALGDPPWGGQQVDTVLRPDVSACRDLVASFIPAVRPPAGPRPA